MVATLVLHVGPHKTGTTALQTALAANQDLLAHHGILYPRTGRGPSGHAVLAEALLRGDASGLTDLSREAQGWRVVLLSSEHLSALEPAGLQALRDCFPGAEPRVAYALRRLVRLWPSHWAELVKHGQDLDFPGYLDRVAGRDDRPFHAPVLPTRQLERLASVFGSAALHLTLYDQAEAEGQDPGPAFIDGLLGLGQIASAFTTLRQNRSATWLETVLVQRFVRHAGRRADPAARQAARLVLLGQLRSGPPPDWLQPLQEALDRADRMVLRSTDPLVAAEQSTVAARHALLVPDGLDSYLHPDQRELPVLASVSLDPAAERLLAQAFDRVLAGLQDGGAGG